MKTKERKFEPLPAVGVASKKSASTTTETTRYCVDLGGEFNEKIKAYCYWEGRNQKDVLFEALQIFMKDKKISPLPETLKNKPKVGRKRKEKE